MGKILFSTAKTVKGAKRLLRKMQERWLSLMDRPELHPNVPNDEEAYALLDGWSDRLELYWPGLFHCYANPHIPATNNELERIIRDLKQLERVLSRNPKPADRFVRNAEMNALVIGRLDLPGEEFLIGCGQEAIRQAEARLRARKKRLSIGNRVLRNWPRERTSFVERWREAARDQPSPGNELGKAA